MHASARLASEAGGQAEAARPKDAGSDGGWAQGPVPVRQERCQIEVMDAAEFGPASFAPFISGQRPLLVRGLADKVAPRLVRDWAKEPFVRKFGSLRFNTSTVGYAEMLRLPMEELSVAEFVARISKTGATSEAQPYIFANDFLRTHPELSGLHELLGEGHGRPVIQPPWMVGLPAWAGYNERDAQDASAGVQFYLGPAGSGAQPHMHEHAWNLAVHGSKRWMIWPPSRSFYAARPAREFAAEAVPKMSGEDAPLTCIQHSGDLLYVPAKWGHSTENIETTIGVAVGFRTDDVLPAALNGPGARSCDAKVPAEPPSPPSRGEL